MPMIFNRRHQKTYTTKKGSRVAILAALREAGWSVRYRFVPCLDWEVPKDQFGVEVPFFHDGEEAIKFAIEHIERVDWGTKGRPQ